MRNFATSGNSISVGGRIYVFWARGRPERKRRNERMRFFINFLVPSYTSFVYKRFRPREECLTIIHGEELCARISSVYYSKSTRAKRLFFCFFFFTAILQRIIIIIIFEQTFSWNKLVRTIVLFKTLSVVYTGSVKSKGFPSGILIWFFYFKFRRKKFQKVLGWLFFQV